MYITISPQTGLIFQIYMHSIHLLSGEILHKGGNVIRNVLGLQVSSKKAPLCQSHAIQTVVSLPMVRRTPLSKTILV